jgi:hypothetical protein
VDEADSPDAQDAMLRLWQENICHPFAGVELPVRGILFVCRWEFPGLDESFARLGRRSEQPVTVEGLKAAGVQPDWADCLTGIARVAPLDEENLMRVVNWVEFARRGT